MIRTKHHPAIAAQGLDNARAPTPVANRTQREVGAAGRLTLERIQALLDAGRAEHALNLINAKGAGSPAMENARAVCLLRMQEPGHAVQTLRGINLMRESVCTRRDVPVQFKTNFATALLLSGNVSGCLSVLSEIEDDSHPRVGQLRAAIHRWEASLSFWQRLLWRLGAEPSCPVTIDFLPGEL